MTYNAGDSPPPNWLREEQGEKGLQFDRATSFIEYLRWMRHPKPEIDSEDRFQQDITKANQAENNDTKARVLQKAVEGAGAYQEYFRRRNQDTQLIAGKEHTFRVTCTWRVRVGGMRGPEDMLLPAFDARGMPYIPSSTLRGVARAAGVQMLVEEQIRKRRQDSGSLTDRDLQAIHQQAEREVSACLGSLEAEEKDRTGKVIFLDAYPLAETWQRNGSGLTIDIANSIWKWDKDDLKYQPNPNLFLSLRQSTFLIGLLSSKRCSTLTLERVKSWLIEGLQAGIGSQINSGYGEMQVPAETSTLQPFLKLKFTLRGQLIHSYQHKDWDRNKNRYSGSPEAEVRPVAFKSMLRYWFRAIALGVLASEEVRDRWEPRLFGSIQPQTRGWVVFRTRETDHPKPRSKQQERERDCLHLSGQLIIALSAAAPEDKRDCLRQLFYNLTWLMFHLGGVGQGSRRPLYRRTDTKPPFYRGSDLKVDEAHLIGDVWSEPPDDANAFKVLFQEKLQGFYQVLGCIVGMPVNHQKPHSPQGIHEVVGSNCKIVVCTGVSDSDKPFALKALHNSADLGNHTYDRDLCGDSNSNPSPIWVSDIQGKYQVVTVFGTHNKKRRDFLADLQKRSTSFHQIWSERGIVS